MRVRAIKTGFYNGLRIPDTDSAEFDVPDGSKATWFAPAKKGKKPAEAPAADTPTADQAAAGEGLV
ncbi:MAG: hypothetical protein ACYCW7_00320 [Pseudomonadaceae bacterium]